MGDPRALVLPWCTTEAAMFLLLSAFAVASPWTPEDLVVASGRGLPDTTIARMAEPLAGPETNVYLLRRGVPAERLASWGLTVAPEDAAAAAHLGSAAPEPTMVLAPEAQHALGRALDGAIADEDTRGLPDPLALKHRRRAGAGLVTGASLAVLGGLGMAYGIRGMTVYEPVDTCDPKQFTDWCEPTWAPMGSTPNLFAIGAGSLGLLGAGLSFRFGAHELSLAGSYPNGVPALARNP